jgi:hypothetical protein
MRITILAMGLVAAVGCGGADDEPSGPCAAGSGSYRVNYTERSGNCGPLPEQIVVVPTLALSEIVCTGGPMSSADLCTVTMDQTCTDTVNDVSTRQEGTVHWNKSASSGSGTTQITLRRINGAFVCSGTYDVSYTRL